MSRSSSEYIASKEEGDTVRLLRSSEALSSSDVDSSYSTSSDVVRVVAETMKRRRLARMWWFLVVLIIVLVSNATTFYVTRSLALHNFEQAVTFPPKGIAPFLRGLNRKLSKKTFDATFYDSKDSVYRKHGSMDTELAWKDLTRLSLAALKESSTDRLQLREFSSSTERMVPRLISTQHATRTTTMRAQVWSAIPWHWRHFIKSTVW